jgi:hypothetical protein
MLLCEFVSLISVKSFVPLRIHINLALPTTQATKTLVPNLQAHYGQQDVLMRQVGDPALVNIPSPCNQQYRVRCWAGSLQVHGVAHQ